MMLSAARHFLETGGREIENSIIIMDFAGWGCFKTPARGFALKVQLIHHRRARFPPRRLASPSGGVLSQEVMTNEQHNKYLGVSFLVHGGLQLFWMLAMGLMFYSFFRSVPGEPGGPPPEFFLFFIVIMAVFQLIITLPSLIAAYALLKHRSWAKTAGVIGGLLATMSFPIGTAVCVYALWFLLGEGGKQLYPQKAGSGGGARRELPPAVEVPWWSEQASGRERERVSPPDWR